MFFLKSKKMGRGEFSPPPQKKNQNWTPSNNFFFFFLTLTKWGMEKT